MCLALPNCTPKKSYDGTFYVMCILPQFNFFFFNGMGLAKKVAVGPSLRQQISALWRMRQGSGLAGGCEGGGEGDQELELWSPQGA